MNYRDRLIELINEVDISQHFDGVGRRDHKKYIPGRFGQEFKPSEAEVRATRLFDLVQGRGGSTKSALRAGGRSVGGGDELRRGSKRIRDYKVDKVRFRSPWHREARRGKNS